MTTPIRSDPTYKLMYTDHRMVGEAVGMAAPTLAPRLDFATATALDAEHLNPEAQRRFGDKVFRVEHRLGELRNGRRRYALALFEFQSSDDPDMAWRMHEYAYLVELGLRQRGVLEAEGRLPEMVPVVVHNGERPWRSDTRRALALVGAGGVRRTAAYAIVDLAAADPFGGALGAGSRHATLLGLERGAPGDLPRLLREAYERHGGAASAGLRRGMHLRVSDILRRHGLEGLPSSEEMERSLAEKRGGRMATLMEAAAERWIAERRAEGMELGMAQGIERGVAQGLAQGRLDMLRRAAELRFGAGGRVASALAGVSDADWLAGVGVWIGECGSGDELLRRIRERKPNGRSAL